MGLVDSAGNITAGGMAAAGGIGAAISGGSGLLGSLGSALFGGWQARRQWKYQKKQMELQQKYALEQMAEQFKYQQQMFDYENEYNSPSNVFARYREAGINPAAVLGSSGASIAATNQSGAGVGSPSGPGGAPGSLGANASAQNIDPLTSSQIASNLSAAARNNSEAGFLDQKALSEDSVRLMLNSTAGKNVAESFLLDLKSDFQLIENSNRQEVIDTTLGELRARTDNLVSQSQLNEEQSKLVQEYVVTESFKRVMYGSISKLNKEHADFFHLLSKNQEALNNANAKEYELYYTDTDGERKVWKVTGYEADVLRTGYAMVTGFVEQHTAGVIADFMRLDKINQNIELYAGLLSDIIGAILSRGLSLTKGVRSTPRTSHTTRVDRNGEVIGGSYTESW